MLSNQDKDAITSHMNKDHADACLLYVQHYAGKAVAVRATLIEVSTGSILLEYETYAAEEGCCRISLPEPAVDRAGVRLMLVEMVKQARASAGRSAD